MDVNVELSNTIKSIEDREFHVYSAMFVSNFRIMWFGSYLTVTCCVIRECKNRLFLSILCFAISWSKNNGIINVNLFFTSLWKTHLSLASLIQDDFTVKMSQLLHVAKSFCISISFLISGYLYFTLSDFE